MRGVFVTGTGTGVGKSIVAAALCAALVRQGHGVLASKPLLSGLDETPPGPWPHDHELLAAVTDQTADEIAPLRFGPPVSPHLAARLEGRSLDVEVLAQSVVARYDAYRDARASPAASADAAAMPVVVVEGAGGLLVPIEASGVSMAALAAELELPLLIAAHPGLGTINHVQLTLEAARARGLAVAGIVLTPWPAEPTIIEADNRAFLERVAGVPVRALEAVAGPDPSALATAGQLAGLPRLLG